MGDPLDGRPCVDGAWRDDPHDAALHEPPAGGRDLLRNRHSVTGRHELLDVAVELVVRHTCQREAPLLSSHRAGSERDAQHIRENLRVVVEALVEVAHAEQEQRSRVLSA